jgi:hypothetical protein
MSRLTQCLATVGACLLAGFGIGAGCDRLPTVHVPKPEPSTLPAEAWCDAACARWQAAGCKEGNDVCDAFGADGECTRYASCLEACEREPHAYPTGMCVADPPKGEGLMQTCKQVRAACPGL